MSIHKKKQKVENSVAKLWQVTTYDTELNRSVHVSCHKYKWQAMRVDLKIKKEKASKKKKLPELLVYSENKNIIQKTEYAFVYAIMGKQIIPAVIYANVAIDYKMYSYALFTITKEAKIKYIPFEKGLAYQDKQHAIEYLQKGKK